MALRRRETAGRRRRIAAKRLAIYQIRRQWHRRKIFSDGCDRVSRSGTRTPFGKGKQKIPFERNSLQEGIVKCKIAANAVSGASSGRAS